MDRNYKFLSRSILILWLMYFLSSVFFNKNVITQGVENLFIEFFFDSLIIIFAIKISRKNPSNRRIFYCIAISFFFMCFSDFYYNFVSMLIDGIPKTYVIDPVDFPLMLFILSQLLIWSVILKNSLKNRLGAIFYDLPILLIGFSIVAIYVYTFRLNSEQLDIIQKVYQNISVIFEMISIFLALLCLILSATGWLTLLLSGYIILVAGDFLARFTLLNGTLVDNHVVQVTWSLGQMIYLFGLFEANAHNLKLDQPWTHNLNSVQARFTLWTHTITVISLGFFILVSVFFSRNLILFKDYFLYNLPSVLIMFCVFSVLISHTFSKELLKPFSIIKNLFTAYANYQQSDIDKEIPKFVTDSNSITEFKELNLFIANSFKTLHEKHIAEHALTNTAVQVAHDIRSPAAALLAITQSCIDLPETDRIALREVATRIQDIANNLLNQREHSEKNIGLVHQYSQSILISPVILQLLSEKRLQYRDSNIKFSYEFTREGSFAFIKIDAVAFKRMLSNLINNAVDAADKDENHIVIHLREDAGSIILIVEDNGSGISQTVLDKIANNAVITDGKPQGHGIGLTQVRETLRYSNAHFRIESQIGNGTEVIVRFPKSLNSSCVASEITLFPDSIVIILDDDHSIHQAWDIKLKPVLCASHFTINVHHFTEAKLAIDYISNCDQSIKKRLLLLTDYELIKQSITGLDVIVNTKIKSAILVTSHYANKEIAEHAAMIGIKILPKLLTSEVPIFLNKSSEKDDVLAKKKVDLVIVDDKETLIKIIVKHFLKEKEVDFYKNPYDFLNHLDKYSFDTKICLDNDFEINDIDGLKLAKQLHQRGYQCLYIASGKSFMPDELPSYLRFVEKHRISDIFDSG